MRATNIGHCTLASIGRVLRKFLDLCGRYLYQDASYEPMARSSQNYNTALAIAAGIFLLGGFMAYEQGGAPSASIKVMDNAMRAEGDNPMLVVAKKQAKSTLPEFIATVQRASPQHHNFSVMITKVSANGTQGLWVHDVTYEQGQFTGVLTQLDASLPASVMKPMSVSEADVIDWFYIEDETIVGSHIMRAMHNQLSATQQQQNNEKLYVNLGARLE